MKKFWSYIKRNILHKIAFWKIKNLRGKIKKYGLPLLVIFIAWEILEDIIFPYIAYLLGESVHPGFYTLMPIAWIACLHPIAVPAIFWIYLKVTKKKDLAKEVTDECKCGKPGEHSASQSE